MIDSVFNSNLLLIWGCHLAINKASLILRLSTLRSMFNGLVGRVFANNPGDLGSIPGCIIPNTLKMILDISLLNTQQYKVYIKSKVEQSREKGSALSYTSV